MPNRTCLICKNSFYAKPNWIKSGWGKYCSKPCRYKAQLTGKNVNCAQCGNQAYKTQTQLRRSKSRLYFCGKSCQTVWRNQYFSGPRHPNWKNSPTTYRQQLLKSKLDKTCLRCGIRDIRLLVVHHIDKNRGNNSIENLTWLCHNCHFLIHHDKVEEESLLVAVAQ